MKQILLFSLLILGSFSLSAQAPDSISFQAVIRAEDGSLLANQEVGVRIVITKGAQQKTNSIEPIDLIISSGFIYEETHQVTTNDNGLVSLIIGNGTVGPESNNTDLSGIDWSDGPYYITRSIDPEGGTNYSITGESQILSVPYALNAKSVGSDAIATIKGENGTLIYAGDLNKSREEVVGEYGAGKYLRISNDPDYRDFDPSTDDDVQIYSMDDIYLDSYDDMIFNSGYDIGLYAYRGINLQSFEGLRLTTRDTVTIRLYGTDALFRVQSYDEPKDDFVTLYEFPQTAPPNSDQTEASTLYALGRDPYNGTTLSWIDVNDLISNAAKTPNNSPSTLEHFDELERKANEMSQQLEESLARIQELEKLISEQQKLIENQLEWNKKLETKLQSN